MTTIYVGITGKDTNSGRRLSRLRTLAHACAIAKAGDRISLKAGEYNEAVKIDVPDGVSIKGAMVRDLDGRPIRSKCTVVKNSGLGNTHCKFPSGDSETLLKLEGKKNVVIDGIYFDGCDRATGQGIYVNNEVDYREVDSNIQISNIALVNFAANGIRFMRTSACVLRNAFVKNSAREYGPGECGETSRGFSKGNIMLSGGSTRVKIENCRIETDGFYGYGIDGSGVKGCEIRGNVFQMHPFQKWNSDPSLNKYPANFNIEFFGGHDQGMLHEGMPIPGVLIVGNRFDRIVSLVTADKNVVRPQPRFLVENNVFDIKEYAIEMATSGIHVIGNRFNGGGYAVLRNFGDKPEHLLGDTVVRGNVARGGFFSFFHSAWPVDNLVIESNEVTYENVGPWTNRTSYFISGKTSPGDVVEGNTIINQRTLPLQGLPDPETNQIS